MKKRLCAVVGIVLMGGSFLSAPPDVWGEPFSGRFLRNQSQPGRFFTWRNQSQPGRVFPLTNGNGPTQQLGGQALCPAPNAVMVQATLVARYDEDGKTTSAPIVLGPVRNGDRVHVWHAHKPGESNAKWGITKCGKGSSPPAGDFGGKQASRIIRGYVPASTVKML